MKEIQFIFDGGLGNQIFQYFASKYISQNFSNLKIKYASSESIKSGYRNLDINELIKEPIIISKEYDQKGERIYSKVINNMPLLSKNIKCRFKSSLDLLNCLYYEKSRKSEDSLSTLKKDLNFLKKGFSKLKIKGYWQNPYSYLDNLDFYNNLIVDTKRFIPSKISPNTYITIHVRRGDYLLKENFENYNTNYSPIEFILLSLHLLPEENKSKPIYLISDDKKWANDLVFLLSGKLGYKFFPLETQNSLEDWSILRHSSINICANSSFSYSAALLNNENVDSKLRCIIPQWIKKNISAFEKGWLNSKGFIEI